MGSGGIITVEGAHLSAARQGRWRRRRARFHALAGRNSRRGRAAFGGRLRRATWRRLKHRRSGKDRVAVAAVDELYRRFLRGRDRGIGEAEEDSLLEHAFADRGWGLTALVTKLRGGGVRDKWRQEDGRAQLGNALVLGSPASGAASRAARASSKLELRRQVRSEGGPSERERPPPSSESPSRAPL